MILSFDVGTSVIKGALFTETGKPLTMEAVSFRAAGPQGNFKENEIDPRMWLDELARLSRKLVENPGLFSRAADAEWEDREISALCISGNGPTLVAADKDGNPVYPALSWLDRRGIAESRQIEELTGRRLDPSFYLPKILWLKKNHPEAYNKAAYFLGCPEYILFRLTGTASSIITGPLLAEYTWSPSILGRLALPEEKFPGDKKPGTILGPLLPEPAAAWGLPPGIPVIAGGPDFVLTLLGSAATSPGRVCDRAGTSEGINLCSTKLNPDTRLMSFEHPVEGLFNTSGSISNSGGALEWFRRHFLDPGWTYPQIYELAETVPPGSRGLIFLPYLSGERAPFWDPRLRGAFVGLSGRHGKAEMLRAVLEGVAFALRHVIQVLEEPGEKVEDLRICGAPGESPLWNQIKADVCGRTILRPRMAQAELSGGALLTLRALGRIPEIGPEAGEIIQFEKEYRPNERHADLYGQLFRLYRRAGEDLTETSRQLADLGGSDS